jgi:hypothetical protein
LSATILTCHGEEHRLLTSDAVLAAAVTGILGVVAAITAAIITARAKDKSVSELASELAVLRASSTSLDVQDFHVRVTDPLPYSDQRSQDFPVGGTFGYVPAGYEIWVATQGVHRDDHGNWAKHYWPQQPAARLSYTSGGKLWTACINTIGGKHDQQRIEFAVLMVGPDGQVLFRHFVKVGMETQQWPAISQLTSDTVECASGSVTFRSS